MTGQVTGRSPTQPQDCGQSPVFRRPAKHLQTTADFRLGRQVTLAQPSASSQGYRLKHADRSSNPGQGLRLQWQPRTMVSLQVFRRPAQHLQTTADSRLGSSGYFRPPQSLTTLEQPGSTRSRPLVAAYTGQVTDRAPTQPQASVATPNYDASRSLATLEPRLTSGSVQVTSHSRDQTNLCGFPANIWLARPTFLLALARRHNQPLIFNFHFSQAPSIPASHQPWRGRSPDAVRHNPTHCGQSQVPRRPA